MNTARIIYREDLERFFVKTGTGPYRLAKAAGVSIQAITRVLTGKRPRCGAAVSERLSPFLYGDHST